MSYEMGWLIPARVLLIEVDNVLSPDETIRIIDECNSFVMEGLPPVHILIDAAKITNTKVNLQEITQLSQFMQNDDIGWWVVINASAMISFAASVVSKLLQKKLKSANSIEEALAILERVDFTLDVLPTLPRPV